MLQAEDSGWPHDGLMNRLSITPFLVALPVVVALSALSSCSIVADEVAEEATQELATEVDRQLESAASATGRPTNDYDLLETVLRDVVLPEAAIEVGSFRPRYTGLVDADDDGLDDDGQVEIVVRRDSSCVRADGDDAVTFSGPCR
jgi:hypothetical protein